MRLYAEWLPGNINPIDGFVQLEALVLGSLRRICLPTIVQIIFVTTHSPIGVAYPTLYNDLTKIVSIRMIK